MCEELSDCFISRSTDCCGKIQRSLTGPHGQSEGLSVCYMFVESRWKACGFAAEDEVIARCEVRIEEGAGGFGGEEPSACMGVVLCVGVPAGMFVEVQAGPIVQAGASASFLAQVEADGVDKVQGHAHGDA